VTIVVAGALANKAASGGEAWVRLSWILGLRRLGVDVVFLEQLAPSEGRESSRDYFASVVAAFGLANRAALIHHDGTDGAAWDDVCSWCDKAALLINISGHLGEPLLSRFRRTAFVDIDPGFTQIWHENGTLEIPPHHVHFTIAENIGRRGCSIPTAGIEWRTTRPPVVLEEWPVASVDNRRFTSVASWRGSYGRIEHAGRKYGVKLDEFRKVLPLPRRCGQPFELALDIHPDERRDLAALREHGWRLVDPCEVAGDPALFRHYVQSSGAEFSVAQGIYVDTGSGWFSDRTTRYLASGKPALVQETGFNRKIPTGEGLMTFRTLDEAAAGAEAIMADYDRHARAARAIAEEHFDSNKVLTRMLEDALE
jgi:hypothetical protein